jgi:hypothetical protein
MRRVEATLPMAECKRRALSALSRYALVRASTVGYAIWPEADFKPQGAGAAASRVLKKLEEDGLVRWVARSGNWGWIKVEKLQSAK